MGHSRITGTGSYLPNRVMTNAELETQVDTSNEWIISRTGIESRHVAGDSELTSDLALHAAQRAIAAAGITAQQIDLIIVATTTPDMVLPSTATILQRKLGITSQCAAFDLQAACTGFVYALSLADKMVSSGATKCALVLGAEIFTRLADWKDRRMCVLFGDGAGAVIVQGSTEPGILSSHLHADGSHGDILKVSGAVRSGALHGNPYLEMDGPAVFKLAVKVQDEVAREALAHNKYVIGDVDWLVPHQANVRIIKATADRLEIDHDRVVMTMKTHANTSCASVPLALDAAVRDQRIKPGHLVMLEAVGAGLTWGSLLMRWSN